MFSYLFYLMIMLPSTLLYLERKASDAPNADAKEKNRLALEKRKVFFPLDFFLPLINFIF